MRPTRPCRWTLAGALFAGSLTPVAAIQVVGDAACGYYDVDIAAFATCVDGRVVRPEAAPGEQARAALPAPSSRTRGDGRGEGPPPRDAKTKPQAADLAAIPAQAHPREATQSR